MKLNPGFIVYGKGDECTLVPSSNAVFSGVVKGNATSSMIFELLKTETTESDIVRKLMQEYEASEQDITESVHSVLTQLREIGAIDD